MTIIIIPQRSGESITITVDATVNESHDNSAQITEDPVEEGPNTSDHYRAELDAFNLNMIFSDQPIVPYPDFTDGVTFEAQSDPNSKTNVLTPDRESDRAQRVYDVLLKSQQDGTLVQVITKRRSYVNVAFRKIRMDRNKTVGKALVIACECKVIRLVQNTTANAAIARPRRPRGNARNNSGARNGSDSDQGDTGTRESGWHRITRALSE